MLCPFTSVILKFLYSWANFEFWQNNFTGFVILPRVFCCSAHKICFRWRYPVFITLSNCSYFDWFCNLAMCILYFAVLLINFIFADVILYLSSCRTAQISTGFVILPRVFCCSPHKFNFRWRYPVFITLSNCPNFDWFCNLAMCILYFAVLLIKLNFRWRYPVLITLSNCPNFDWFCNLATCILYFAVLLIHFTSTDAILSSNCPSFSSV